MQAFRLALKIELFLIRDLDKKKIIFFTYN